jgi:SAM-dependent methyltransferase
VLDVADKVSSLAADPLRAEGIACGGLRILEYGCGPAHASKALLRKLGAQRLHDSQHHRTPSADAVLTVGKGRRAHHAAAPPVSGPPSFPELYLCDLCPDMLAVAQRNLGRWAPASSITVHAGSAFEGAAQAAIRPEFTAWLPAELDVAFSSLVCEYLSAPQIKALGLQMWSRLRPNGVLLFVEWGKHDPYPAPWGEGVVHQEGISKAAWLRMVAELVAQIEEEDSLPSPWQEKAGAATTTGGATATPIATPPLKPLNSSAAHTPDPTVVAAGSGSAGASVHPSPASPASSSVRPLRERVELTVGTMPVSHSHEQVVSSGDEIHFVLFRKRVVSPA